MPGGHAGTRTLRATARTVGDVPLSDEAVRAAAVLARRELVRRGVPQEVVSVVQAALTAALHSTDVDPAVIAARVAEAAAHAHAVEVAADEILAAKR